MKDKKLTKRVIKRITPKVTPVGMMGTEAMVLPNHSGDNIKGFVSKTPVDDVDFANKKYVDDNAGSDGSDHNIVSHDTTATGAELNTLTNNSIANTLHRHSELVASDGSPDPALMVDCLGNVGIGTTGPGAKLDIVSTTNYDEINITAANGASLNLNQPQSHASARNWGLVTNWGAWGNLEFKISVDNAAVPTASKMTILSSGNVGIGTESPSEKLDINSDAIRIRTAQTPASAGATGTAGMICWDANYIYVCTATNTWKRTAIASW